MEQSVKNQKSILMIDDNPDNLELLSSTFTDINVSVTTCGSVAQARHLLQQDNEFDLILSDISMPVETGFDLLAWLAKAEDARVRETPVLLITSELPDAPSRIKGLALGAVDYVIRPIPAEELILRVSHAIDNVKRYKGLRAVLQDNESQANVGRLLAASNHEIRNLTGLVLVSANSLANHFVSNRSGSSDHIKKNIESLTNAAQLLAEISRSMTTLLNERKAKLSAICLTKVIQETLALTEMKTKQFKVLFDRQALPEIWCTGNSALIKQILINFIFNACDSLSEGSKEGIGHIQIKVTDDGNEYWHVRISDDGVGLPVKDKLTTFTPFKTTKSIRGGTGLGLWLCARLADSMHGSLSLESDGLGKGATAIMKIRKCPKPIEDEPIDFAKYLES